MPARISTPCFILRSGRPAYNPFSRTRLGIAHELAPIFLAKYRGIFSDGTVFICVVDPIKGTDQFDPNILYT